MATSTPTPTTHTKTTTCPHCLGTINATPTEHACQRCGLVIEDSPIAHDPDWPINDTPGESHARGSPDNRMHADHGLGTTLESHTNPRLKTYQRHALAGSTKDRNRGYATTDIHRMTHALGLPEHVGEQAKHHFTTLHNNRDLGGRDLDALAAASLYLSLRQEQSGLTASELAGVARTDERSITRRMHWIANELELEVPPPSIQARVRVIASRLNAQPQVTQRAVEWVRNKTNGDGYTGSPSTLAAAALYKHGPWTQQRVADAGGVSATGVRQCQRRVSK